MRRTTLAARILVVSLLAGTTAKTYAAKRKPRRNPYDHNPVIVYYADAYADHFGVKRELIHAFIDTESAWNPYARSKVGAQGLMQLMPDTARDEGVVRPYSVSDNLYGGVLYISRLLREYNGDVRLVAAAYYSGTRWVDRKGLRYSNPDVTNYVRTVRYYYVRELQLHARR